jgi:glycosyltransferase involved in cell wall biosynthesis
MAFVSQHFDLLLPPDQTSVGIWTREVSRRLRADVTVIARRPRGMSNHTTTDGTRMEFLRCAPCWVWARAAQAWGHLLPAARPLFAHAAYASDYYYRALQRLRAVAPDVIHLQNFPLLAPAIRRAVPGAALVLHMHSDWLAQLDRVAIRRSLAAVDVVAGCSGHVISAALARFPETNLEFAVLPNGASVTRDAPCECREPQRVVFIGRISPEKGIHTLLEAWPQVAAACPSARLEIVGPPAETPREFLIDLSEDMEVRGLARFYRGGADFRGSYVAALQAMVPPHLANTVTFVGHEPHQRVLERCARAALLVNPSLSESFGMSLIEALAAETPIVATKIGGMPEIVHATEGGLLVKHNDPEHLAGAIIRVLRDPKLAREMGSRGRRRVAELYSWERVAVMTQELHAKARARRELANVGIKETVYLSR